MTIGQSKEVKTVKHTPTKAPRIAPQKVKYFTLLGSFPVSRASSISWFGTGENTLKFSKPSALSFFIASTRTSTYV